MQTKPYRRYFNFILKHWNLQLALFTIVHEIRGEKKYGIDTTGYDNLATLEVTSGNKHAAYIYQPVNFFMAEKAFNYLSQLQPTGSLVDFGCGRGRILAVAAHYGFKHVTGVEFAPELCEAAAKTVDKMTQKFPDFHGEIFCEDAIDYKLKDADTVFTFFNPFDDRVMLPVVKNIMRSYRKNPRDLIVIYFNPTEKEMFLSAGFTELWYYSKMKYLDLSILHLPQDE